MNWTWADDLESVPAGPPVSQAGDLWLLGEHRILCASALDRAAYSTLMEGEKADLIFTDPRTMSTIDFTATDQKNQVSRGGAAIELTVTPVSPERNHAEGIAAIVCSLWRPHRFGCST